MPVTSVAPGGVTSVAPRARRWPVLPEAAAVVLSPLVTFFALRIRAMAPVGLPDPSMHTIYIVDPREMFIRYSAAFAATARLREGAQVGFLLPGHLAYLAFGAVPGFFVTRYVFALVAIVPAYLVFRRLYGIPAGTLAIIVLLSSPVVITAWGTDYPDSAVVSYVAGAVACLAMACGDRWRSAWVVLAGVLLTMAIWSHGMGILLAGTTVAVYLAVRLLRDRRQLLGDVALLAATSGLVTLVLMIGSGLVFGQFDFIRPTLAAAAYLNKPSQTRLNHFADWHWAPYVAYLLVPPSVLAVFGVTFARKLRAIPTPQLFVGLVGTAQFALFVYLQFFNHVQTLQMHFFSSTIWGVIDLVLALSLAELARPLWGRPLARWVPPVLVVAVALAYEADPHVPAFGWLPVGAALAAIPVLLAGAMRLWTSRRASSSSSGGWLEVGVAVTVIGMAGSLLVLTVAPQPSHAPLPGISVAAQLAEEPPSNYNGALGGDARPLIDWYRISADLPSFVGNATYRGEQLLMWFPSGQAGTLTEPVGMYHEGFDALPTGLPHLSAADAGRLAYRRPAELLLLSTTGAQFETALAALAPYRPVLLRTTVMREGAAVLHAWLIGLGSFARRAS